MKLNDLALDKNVKYNDKLHPKLWDGESLKPEVRQKLIEIGEAFFEALDVEPTALHDFYVVGSCANYNWNQYSDIDLHVLMDYKIVAQSCNDELIEDFLWSKRAVWLDKYDINVLGLKVEVGPQDISATLESAAVYSLMENNWIKKPVKSPPKIDEDKYDDKVELMKKKINVLLAKKNVTADEIDKLQDELKNMRQAGLDKGGEFNPDNLAFKSLRNQGYLDKLNDLKTDKRSEELSL